jgi:tetratricopeptide (TPR) repeat protein
MIPKVNKIESRGAQLLQKGSSLYNTGKFKQALKFCDLSYEVDPYRTDVLLLLTAIHFQLGNYEESAFFARQSLDVDSNFAEGHSNLGNALKELGDYDGAIKHYIKVRAIRKVNRSFSLDDLRLLS